MHYTIDTTLPRRIVVGFKAEFAEYIIELRGKHKYTYKKMSKKY